VSHPALSTSLSAGEFQITGRLRQASNATFLADLRNGSGPVRCVYKPIAGERPLWDFPRQTLGLREVAAYEVSRIGGFDLVPVTALVDGPLGPGSLQVWVDEDEAQTTQLVDLVPTSTLPRDGWYVCLEGIGPDDQPVSVIHADRPDLRLLAVFDALINNADRKGGHILGSQGRIFGVDHGVSFHTDAKLRTLLWGWAGTELTSAELDAVERARTAAPEALDGLLSPAEIGALLDRADALLRDRRLPQPNDSWPSLPWPPF
jgi:uncharacterized repeat protein (TIGR03843 family)